MPMITPAWPRAIVHVDGDAFFASVEQAVNPALKGKPVVTGKERNIVAAASYEAKALGIRRGVTLWDAKKMCPDLVVLPTDYEAVSLFSRRMFDIMRRFTPDIEEYGIDEAFADITGLRRLHHTSYPAIAYRMQEEIINELGISVSVGLSTTKTLAKTASKKNKPRGLVVASARERENLLADLPVGCIWNVGPNTAALLERFKIHTALDFTRQSENSLSKILSKPGLETWQELNGIAVLPLGIQEKESYQSISKTKTFTPPSTNEDFVYAQLIKNVENACIKARRYSQAPQRISIFLKRQDHRSFGLEATLARPSAYPHELSPVVRQLFSDIYKPNTLYRATGVILTNLVSSTMTQPSLFEEPLRLTKIRNTYIALDALREKYGKHVVHLATTLPAQRVQHLTSRGDTPYRKLTLLKGETKRRRLPVPMFRAPI